MELVEGARPDPVVEPSSPASPPAQEPAPVRDASPPPREKIRYKSWRKKYRKMKYTFDDRMEESNNLFLANWKAEQVARRIKEQNDQLLEILLDINDSPDTPATKRYDLQPRDSHNALTPQSPNSTRRAEAAVKLSALEQRAIHTTKDVLQPSLLPADIQDAEYPPPGYLTPAHEDEYLGAMDEALEALPLPNLDFPSKTIGNAVLDPNVDIRPRKDDPPTERDFAVRCSVSVYNWVKQHQPQVHADKEEKGRKDDRGGGGGGGDSDRGGRSPPPMTPAQAAGSKRKTKDKLKKEDAPFETLDDEIGFDATEEPTFGSGKGRKKKDDEAYRPKGGKSRSVKRKRDREDGSLDGDFGGPKRARKIGGDDGTD